MSISFTLPADVEQHLRDLLGDVDLAAKEAALVELYRQEVLTHHQLASALGIDRFEADALLKRHNVTEDLLTVEQFREQMKGMNQLLGE